MELPEQWDHCDETHYAKYQLSSGAGQNRRAGQRTHVMQNVRRCAQHPGRDTRGDRFDSTDPTRRARLERDAVCVVWRP